MGWKSTIGAGLTGTLLALQASPHGRRQSRYDVVLRGGRVMDPETGLDAVRDVGITGGRIAKISGEALAGRA